MNAPERDVAPSEETAAVVPEDRADEAPSASGDYNYQTHFTGVSQRVGKNGPVGELVSLLASGSASLAAFNAVRDRHGVRRERWFSNQVLDLVLEYISEVLQRNALGPVHRGDLQWLRRCLDIPDGEFMRRRPAELASLLGDQLDRILEDGVIDQSEELLQVELQAAFGVGYDDYLSLTRGAFERAFDALGLLARNDASAAKNLLALEPIYRLATSRPRTLGALY